jgi:hypothetical protein
MLYAILAVTVALSTPIPRDQRPDFRNFAFMAGTWNCSIASSRRPRSFSAQSTTKTSSDGYWLVTTTITPPVPWNNIRITAIDYVTYDPTRSLWIDLTMDDYGLYGVSTSHGWAGRTLVWQDVLFPTSHATAIHFPRIVSETTDKKTTTVQRFKEPSGQSFAVTTTCAKREGP